MKFDEEHKYICEKCNGPVQVIPESQASAILKCLDPKCGHEEVILF